VCNGRHAGIGLDRKDFSAAFDQLPRGDPGAGAHIKNAAST
jgi:hypothetical protein